MNSLLAQKSTARIPKVPISSSKGATLASVREKVAAMRVLTEATRIAGAVVPPTAPIGDSRMVPVFQLPIKRPETLSSDRDDVKREERILATLNQRGALRLLGAEATPQLAESIARLYQTHANFSTAIDHVLTEEVLMRQTGGSVCGLRVLLTGGAGIGKTDFSLSLAKLLGLPCQVISMSSSQSAAHLGGSETFWGNSKPGVVWESLVQGSYANPLFILDEIDKAPDNWGSPLGALFQLLEPRTAAVFTDKSVPWLPIDASRVNWICTANDSGQLHPAIRSRFIEIAIEVPEEAALRALVQSLYESLLQEFGLIDRFPAQLSRAAEDALLGQSVRESKRLLRSALGQALRSGEKELSVSSPPAQAASNQRIGFI